jgi:hypothetical protein
MASISGTMNAGRSRSITRAQRARIEHVDDMRAVRDLHRRRVG